MLPLLPHAPARARRLATATVAIAVVGPATAPALAVETVPGEIVVQEHPHGAQARAASRVAAGHRVIRVKDVGKALRAVRRRSTVVYAVPNVKARAAALVPNDPGRGSRPGGWQNVQWNFVGPFSVNAPDAWANLAAAGRTGGSGVTVAVLDTGVAYRARAPFLKSPDLRTSQFVRGYDFVDRDPYPYDRNGHGTHVASTIGEATNNGVGLTGLAYGARIMPIRVLDTIGEGDALAIAKGVRFATRRGAHIINLSLEFSPEITSEEIPELLDAIAAARQAGILVVGASGNEGYRNVAWPARASNVLAVGATTERGCLSEFSNEGRGLDIVAPGGGQDAGTTGEANCLPSEIGRPIYQLTFTGSVRSFGLPGTYEGTSMAAPHVSATAALVIASKVLGEKPTPSQLTAHLKRTARDLGPKGYDTRYGAGLIDAGAATVPVT